jgi:hypothetical protein
MTKAEFLQRIYSTVEVGMPIQKPRKLSTVLAVSPEGNISYLIGTSNSKTVTREDLRLIYRVLRERPATGADLRAIAGPSRPCNVTTYTWILKTTRLAELRQDGQWHRAW